ncbi:hypothetical protein DUT90_09450 [Polaribacter sp. WD7]|uniref:hypothetical protein n=1 Tax=Polaribacter sp. WD7 TaxID=2269061 RepID=UPI000DF36B87|nr:hypothetical protein [Polaribacter sp. WD7]RCS25995.1 hypothetical protein DUT90_09450 [Polaribacter sp. WD7]
MFLQILPADKLTFTEIVLENQLAFVVLGMAISAFAIIRAAKYLSKIKIVRVSNKPSYTS